MPKLYLADQVLQVPQGLRLLRALEGLPGGLAGACSMGYCGRCAVELLQGAQRSSAQEGLPETLRQRGWVKACLYPITQDTRIAWPLPHQNPYPVKILQRQQLHAQVLRLLLEKPFSFKPGDAVRVQPFEHRGLPPCPAACFTLVSLPSDNCLELHISLRHQGQMATWLTQAQPGEMLQVFQPQGHCHLQTQHPQQPLYLFGQGTGMGAVLALARWALASGHQGPVHCVLVAQREDEFYPLPRLAQVVASGRVEVVYWVKTAGAHADTYRLGDPLVAWQSAGSVLPGAQVYAFGDWAFIRRVKRWALVLQLAPEALFLQPYVPTCGQALPLLPL
jgi:ferredoxin-NADP reductase/ferredoxin